MKKIVAVKDRVTRNQSFVPQARPAAQIPTYSTLNRNKPSTYVNQLEWDPSSMGVYVQVKDNRSEYVPYPPSRTASVSEPINQIRVDQSIPLQPIQAVAIQPAEHNADSDEPSTCHKICHSHSFLVTWIIAISLFLGTLVVYEIAFKDK